MSRSDLAISILLRAVDEASGEIAVVQRAVRKLREELDRSEFSRSADGMERFASAVKDSTQPMADAAKRGLALSAALTAVATALGNRFYQAAKADESALSDLSKVLSGGQQEAEKYAEQLNALAIAYGQSGESLKGVMADFVQAGYAADEAFGLVENALKLNIAGDLKDNGVAAKDLISILKGFNAPASEAAHAVDLLNEVSNRYATDVGQLAEGMRVIAPIAQQMGFGMDEAAGLLTPIIEVFQSGAEAGDALKTGLLRLVDDAKPVSEALAKLGVAQKDANGEMRSGKEIFIDVARAMEGLSDKQKIYFTAQLSGIDQAARMSKAFSDVSKYMEITATAESSAGSAAREVEIRLQTAAYQAQIADEKFRQLSVTLGNQYKQEVTGVVAATGELAKAFDAAVKDGGLEPLIAAIRPQVQALEGLLTSISANLGTALDRVDWTPLVDGIKDLSGEFGEALNALFEGFDLTTVDGLKNLIQSLINLLGDFSHYVAGLADGMGPLLSALNTLFGVASSGHPTLARLSGEIEGLALSANQIIPAISNLGNLLFGSVGAVIEWTAKIGLAVAALGLLSRAGVPVLGILGTLAARFFALNPAVAALVASLTGLGGAVGALGAATGAAGFSLGLWINHTLAAAKEGTALAKVFDLIATEAEKVQRHLNSIDERGAAGLEEIGQRTGVTVRNMQEFSAAVEQGRLVFDEVSGKWVKGAGSAAKLGDETTRAAKTLKELNAIAGTTSAALGAQNTTLEQSAQVAAKLAAAQRQASSAQAAYVAAQRNGLASADELGRAWQRAEAEVQKLKAGLGGAGQALSGAGTATQAAADKASALAKAEVAARQAHAAYQNALNSGTGDVDALGRAWEAAEAKVRRLKTAAQEAGQTVGKSSKDQAIAAAAEAAALDAAIAAHVSYGQWVERSGEADRAAINARAELAKAVGDQGDRVRDLTLAYIEAQKNQVLGDDDSAAGVKALADELGEAKAKYEELQRQLADKAQVDIQVKTEGADQAKAEIDQLAEPTESTHSITTNASKALSEIDQLAGHDTSSTHTVYVRTVEQHTLGGLIGQFLLHRAGGGSVFNRPGWSVVPGVGNVDSVPAGLPSGAYVLRKAAARYYGPLLARLNAGGIVPTLLTPGERWFGPGTVRKHGIGLFEALNRLQIPRDALAAALAGATSPVRRFNAGGSVGASASPGQSVTASPVTDTLNINLAVGSRTVKLQGAREQAATLVRALKELERGL